MAGGSTGSDRRDRLEGVDAHGMIRTGVDRAAVPPLFVPVLADIIEAIPRDVEVHLYGSVSTGRAVPGVSDVDLLTVGLRVGEASMLATELSARHRITCREVAISAAAPDDLVGDHDEAYGNRVFLRHYCVQLAGSPRPVVAPFPADRRAARGFNGDIARHRDRWLDLLTDADPTVLARVVARKTLLAVAGIVSIRDSTWTTDRRVAVQRWMQTEPDADGGISVLAGWVDSAPDVSRSELESVLRTTVATVVDRFEDEIGLWV